MSTTGYANAPSILTKGLQETDGSLKALEEQQRSCVFRALDQG